MGIQTVSGVPLNFASRHLVHAKLVQRLLNSCKVGTETTQLLQSLTALVIFVECVYCLFSNLT